jgi:hypothetical protein
VCCQQRCVIVFESSSHAAAACSHRLTHTHSAQRRAGDITGILILNVCCSLSNALRRFWLEKHDMNAAVARISVVSHSVVTRSLSCRRASCFVL